MMVNAIFFLRLLPFSLFFSSLPMVGTISATYFCYWINICSIALGGKIEFQHNFGLFLKYFWIEKTQTRWLTPLTIFKTQYLLRNISSNCFLHFEKLTACKLCEVKLNVCIKCYFFIIKLLRRQHVRFGF